MAQWQGILTIPLLKTERKTIEYLTPEGIKLLFAQPDLSTEKGRRHLALLSIMYDTAARVQEVADLTMGSLRIEAEPYTVKIVGKEQKARIVPLSSETFNACTQCVFITRKKNGVDYPEINFYYFVAIGAKEILDCYIHDYFKITVFRVHWLLLILRLR